MKEELNTEEKIIEAAKKVFYKKGLAGARMQDIADEAGINKALLHYYFRSKEKLFDIIMQEAVKKMIPRLNEIFNSEDTLESKIEQIVEKYISGLMENPFIPAFVVNELNQNPQRISVLFQGLKEKPNPMKFLMQIQEEVGAGKIRPIDPIQLFVNLVSMCIFPLLAEPLAKTLLQIEDDAYKEFLTQRKKEVASFIIQSIRK